MKHRENAPSRRVRTAIASCIALACAACGGGSGSDDGGPGDGDPAPIEPTARITPANAFEAAHVAAVLGRVASLPELFVFVGDPPGGGGPPTVDCTGGGGFAHGFDVDAAPLGEISSGDVYFVHVEGCSEEHATLDGALAATFVEVQGDVAGGEAFEFALDLAVQALTETSAGGERSLDAVLASHASVHDGVSTYVQSGSASAARIGDGAGVAHELHELEVSASTLPGDGGSVERIYRFDAIFECSAIDGVLTIETPLELTAFGNAYPHLGELLIRGGGGSSLRVVALDSQLVELRIDADGDGTAEASAQLLWSEL